MLARLVIRIVNILIAITGIALLAGFWWFFYRPLPQVSGEIQAPITSRISISRDALGIPHIHAANQPDLWFAQGYVVASERLWQMDGLRRRAAGDLSEIVGPATLELDRSARRLRTRRIAEDLYSKISPQDRSDIDAYARGVNYFLNTHHNRLSFEFAALGYDPRPWSTIDTLLIWLYMYRDLTTAWPDHIQRAALLAHGNPAKVELLFPVRGGDAVQPGSNSWAVSGAHTASGHPQLSSDAHLEYSVPGIWFAVALDAPGLRAMGVALPGAPGVIIGHNDRIAWGVTNLQVNVQDLYREKLDDRTGQYEFAGKTEQARLERDLIQIKGGKPEEFRQWVTRHGPVISDENGEHLALRWAAAEPDKFAMTFTDLDRARNWQDFNTALAKYPGPGQNFVYADVDGNIGYHAAGNLPIRHGYTGDVPVDGSDGKSEWDGFIPYDQLPMVYNPPSGIIATANQNPFPANYPYYLSGSFAAPYRVHQIFDMLKAKPKLTPQDTLAIQKDVYSGFELFIAHQLVNAWDKQRSNYPDLEPAISRLRSFNGQMDKDSTAAFIAVLSDHYVRRSIADSAAPGSGSAYANSPAGSRDPYQMSTSAAEHILRERPAGWFTDWDRMLLDALRDALGEARRLQGHNLDKWRYGNYLKLTIAHPVGNQLPLVGEYFNIGPIPMSGAGTSVKQTTRRLGPSERINAVVGDWDRSLMNLPVGESGHVLSPHYKDQWDAYYNGRSFPMQFDHVDVKSTLTLLPQP